MNMIYCLTIFVCLSGVVLPAQSQSTIQYEEISPGLWIHESSFNKIKSNGLIVEHDSEVTLVDTPWDNKQTKELLSWIKTNLNKPVTHAIVTHSHDDRAGGARALTQAGIVLLGHEQTNVIVRREQNLPIQPVVSRENPIYETQDFEIFYPGPGHTRDNVTVWFPQQSVLFGGCFLKSAQTKGMGYIKESDIIEWPKSVSKLAQRYPDAKIVIPGHGKPAGMDAIENTTQLLNDYIRDNHKNACASCLSEW